MIKHILEGRKFVVRIDEKLHPQIDNYQVLPSPDGVFVGYLEQKEQLTGAGGGLDPVITTQGAGGVEINEFGRISPGIRVNDLHKIPPEQSQFVNLSVIQASGGIPTG